MATMRCAHRGRHGHAAVALVVVLAGGVPAWATSNTRLTPRANGADSAARIVARTPSARSSNPLLGDQPVAFEANTGQCAGNVRYIARGKHGSVFLTSHDAVLTIGDGKTCAAVHLAPIGGAAEPAIDRVAQARRAVSGPSKQVTGWQQLQARVDRLPEAVRDMAGRGLKKVVDYQDLAYGGEYLDRLDKAVALDDAGHNHALSIAAAKHVANAMCYDDMIRVADLKTRSTRDARVRREVGVKDGTVLQVTEYFHPRIEEFCGTMPVRLGRYIENRPRLARFLDRRINRGRHIRTDSMTGFAMLWVVGGLRRWRRGMLRHAVEAEHLERWYRLALDHAAKDYALAVEILECRRLIKGYSDTHVRAQSKFDRVLSGLKLLDGRADAAEWLRRLREAALKDEKGDLLDGALKTVASLNG